VIGWSNNELDFIKQVSSYSIIVI